MSLKRQMQIRNLLPEPAIMKRPILIALLVLWSVPTAYAGWVWPHFIFSFGPTELPGTSSDSYWSSTPTRLGISIAGEVDIKTQLVGKHVYVDGVFAGITGTLKKLWLPAGDHIITIEDYHGRVLYLDRVEVRAGKNISINSPPACAADPYEGSRDKNP